MKSGPWLASAAAIALAGAAFAQTPPVAPPKDQALGREILKQLVETDTTHAHGSTAAAQEIAQRALAAGFAPEDVKVIAPPQYPARGNVIIRYRGTGDAKPILYLCHLDVVEARKEDWTYDPFKLTEADGWLYGRGTIDMKGQDAAVLESLLRLKAEGFKPNRDIIFAFTADEEAGGSLPGYSEGIDYLLKNDRPLIDAELVINPDAGGGEIKNGRKLDMLVQTSEKMFLTFQLETRDRGGHSSMPTPANPIYRMSRALAKLGDYQFPLNLTTTMKAYFAGRALLESGQVAADMREASTGILSPGALQRLSNQVETNVDLRTTCVATTIDGGQGESALPERVKALVQCRVIPGESPADIQRQIVKVIGDPAIQISVYTNAKVSPESPLTPKVMDAVRGVSDGMWPKLPILPNMSAGASDSAYTRMAGMPSYGVDGIFTDVDDDRAHGRDERVSIEGFNEELEFTYRLMKRLGEES
ncbi:MAG: M20/M25/M40 family metallo-hydrolase [Caulobacteraceae bacterium]|nr:M20/M25/M40 family metallo-hydrolase [Caulobacteraceae bacterium]